MADDEGDIPSNDGGQQVRYDSEPDDFPKNRNQKQRRSTRIRKPSQADDRGVRRKPDSGASHEYLARVRKLLERVKEQVKREQEGNRPSRSRSKVRNSRNSKSRKSVFQDDMPAESDGSSPDIPEGREEFNNPTKQEKPAARKRGYGERQSVPQEKGGDDAQEQVEVPKKIYGLLKVFKGRYEVSQHALSSNYLHIIVAFFNEFLTAENHYLECKQSETAFNQIKIMENVLRTLLFRILEQINHTIKPNSLAMISLLDTWKSALRTYEATLNYGEFVGKERSGHKFRITTPTKDSPSGASDPTEEQGAEIDPEAGDGGALPAAAGGDQGGGGAPAEDGGGGNGDEVPAEYGEGGDGGGEPAAAEPPSAQGSAPGPTYGEV